MDRKSFSSDDIYLNGDMVAWYTHKQLVAAVSWTEAEYIAVSDACKDGLYIYHFMNAFVQVDLPIHMFMDNPEAMYMANNPRFVLTSTRVNAQKHPRHPRLMTHL